jgi:hypothetical protein
LYVTLAAESRLITLVENVTGTPILTASGQETLTVGQSHSRRAALLLNDKDASASSAMAIVEVRRRISRSRRGREKRVPPAPMK